ncbi:mucin-2-like [Halichondria panicea]|uniref:mucin-2-like n=1 Tax=Halichondria panicea TaxID=6063 RepID=UPI00312B6438
MQPSNCQEIINFEMILIEIKLICRVLLICFLAGFSTVSVERLCPMETVTFTCTANGDSLRWVSSDSTSISILSTSDLNVPIVVSGYTVTLIAFNDTTLTSTLSRTAENGITVSCLGFVPVTTIGSSTIRSVDPPGPPSTIRHSISSSSADAVSVPVQWNPPTETGGRDDLTYTVTVSPLAQLSATVLTSTSVTVTAQYNVDYAVSVVATNCAGSSTTADYNFRIGNCPTLTNPMNGVFGPVSSRLSGSTVTIQCDAGYVSTVTMVTCESTLMWSPDPEAIECTSLTTPTPTTPPPINCTAPLSPPLEPPTTAAPCNCNCNCASLSDGSRFDAAVSISVVVTAILFTIIGLFVGLLIMYLFMHKKNVYSPSAKEQANVGPTTPAGPVYEEVSPKEEIELNTNQAYGPVGL